MMGGALFRKCWDVQEEQWGGHDQSDKQSIDDKYHYDYYQNQNEIYPKNHFHNRSSI